MDGNQDLVRLGGVSDLCLLWLEAVDGLDGDLDLTLRSSSKDRSKSVSAGFVNGFRSDSNLSPTGLLCGRR